MCESALTSADAHTYTHNYTFLDLITHTLTFHRYTHTYTHSYTHLDLITLSYTIVRPQRARDICTHTHTHTVGRSQRAQVPDYPHHAGVCVCVCVYVCVTHINTYKFFINSFVIHKCFEMINFMSSLRSKTTLCTFYTMWLKYEVVLILISICYIYYLYVIYIIYKRHVFKPLTSHFCFKFAM